MGLTLCIGECSRKRFSDKQAEQWWAENRARVYEQYNVRMIDKSTIGVGSEDMAHWCDNLYMRSFNPFWQDLKQEFAIKYLWLPSKIKKTLREAGIGIIGENRDLIVIL